MNITADDPRLTAYVLDELDPEGTKLIENEMARCYEIRFEARKLADFTDQLRDALATEPMPELRPNQRRAIEMRLQQTVRKPFWVPIESNWLLKTELAILVLVVLWFLPLPASLSTPANQIFADASLQTTRAMLKAVGTRVEWSGSSLILPAPRTLPLPPGVKVPPGSFRGTPAGTITIDFETWLCNSRFWTPLLLVTGFLMGNLYLRSVRKILALTLFTIPLVIFSDALRKFVLAEWLVHTDWRTAQGPVFHLAPLLFVVFSMFALLVFLIGLRRSEKKRI